MPSGSSSLTVTFLYSFPSIVLKSSANVNDADSATKIASAVCQVFTHQIVPLLRSTPQWFFLAARPDFPLKLNCHAWIKKWNSVCRLDQVPRDSDYLADHHLSGFDHRLRDVRLALGSVNRLTGRFAAICSTFKSDTGTIPDAHSHRSACNESNTDNYTDTDAVTKSSAYAGAPSDSSTPPPIAPLIGFEHLNASRRRLQFQKRSQPFIRAHNEALPVAAMRVYNPDRSPVRINRWDAAPTPTGFCLRLSAIISQYFTRTMFDNYRQCVEGYEQAGDSKSSSAESNKKPPRGEAWRLIAKTAAS